MLLKENILNDKQKSCILLIWEGLPNYRDPKTLAQPAVFLAVAISKAGHIGSF